MKELLCGADFDKLQKDIQSNLNILLDRINKLRKLWGKPMTVTSGFRSMSDHICIYQQKAKQEGKKFDMSKIPMKSKHLSGQAVDIYDPDFSLTKWCKQNNSKVLFDIGLWCEDDTTVPRLHFQTEKVSSGNRWFKP